MFNEVRSNIRRLRCICICLIVYLVDCSFCTFVVAVIKFCCLKNTLEIEDAFETLYHMKNAKNASTWKEEVNTCILYLNFFECSQGTYLYFISTLCKRPWQFQIPFFLCFYSMHLCTINRRANRRLRGVQGSENNMCLPCHSRRPDMPSGMLLPLGGLGIRAVRASTRTSGNTLECATKMHLSSTVG